MGTSRARTSGEQHDHNRSCEFIDVGSATVLLACVRGSALVFQLVSDDSVSGIAFAPTSEAESDRRRPGCLVALVPEVARPVRRSAPSTSSAVSGGFRKRSESRRFRRYTTSVTHAGNQFEQLVTQGRRTRSIA